MVFLYHDGTTWDHTKIVGQQLTLSTGEKLPAGFTMIATADSSTLLDITFSLMKELALVF